MNPMPFHTQDDQDRGQVEGPSEEGCKGQAGPHNSQHPNTEEEGEVCTLDAQVHYHLTNTCHAGLG